MSVAPADSPSDPATEDRVYRKVTRRIVPLLFSSYVLAYLDRVNVGFAKLQMQQDLQFSETVYGLGAGIFFIGYFLFEVPSNLILHRTGARIWIARIMVTWGLISAAMMFVKTPQVFYALRFLLGLAEAGFFPGIILYLTYWYPAARRGQITALFMTAVAFSGIIGGPLSGWIMQSFAGLNGWSGWQWLFLVEGIPSVLMGVVVFFFLDDSIKGARWLEPAEKELLARNVAAEAQGKSAAPAWQALLDRRVWLLAAIYFMLVMGLYGIGFWLPQLIRNTGVQSVFHVGLLTAIPYAAAAIAMILVSRHSDRTGERRWHTAWSAIAGAIGLGLSGYLGDQTGLAMVAFVIATAGILTSLPIFWSLPTGLLSGFGAAAGIGLVNSFGNLAGFVSPMLIGRLKDATGSTTWGLYALALCLTAGAGLALLAPVPRRSP